MSIAEYAAATSRSYSTLLREVSILGKLIISRQLAFNMQAQTQTNWCWAATATSVSHFYWLLSSWTQCRVANQELGRSDCCNSMVPSQCNVPWYLDKALTRTNNFVNITGPVSFQQVRDEIDAGRTVGARIGWSGGGGHFMVIYGYSVVVGTEYFDIDDPIYGKSHLLVNDFSNNYQGSGSWTHTYFTKSYFKLPIKFLIPREPILRRIWEARPLLDVKLEPYTSRDPREIPEAWQASVGLAQRIYSIELRALLSEKDSTPKPIALRVFETIDNKPRAFFDLTDEDEPRIQQMSTSVRYVDLFTRALTEAVNVAGRTEQECEIRLLRIPALNFDALWLKYENGRDTLVPLFSVGTLTAFKTIPYDEAFAALREAARPLAEMDDTMGA
jgi:hypothetical protein